MDDFKDLELPQDMAGMLNVEINVLNDDDYELNYVPSPKRSPRFVLSESEESDSANSDVIDSDNTPSSSTWTAPLGNQRVIPFTGISGLPPCLRDSITKKKFGADFFDLIVSDEIFQEIVDCTNEFANHKIDTSNEDSKYARLNKWTPTNLAEIKKFFGLILFMGIVKLPRMADYWSTDEVISHPYPRTVMSRNRFELLLQTLHFSHEDEANTSNRLHPVSNLLKMLNTNYQKYYTPAEDLYIDESIVPLQGRIILRQNNKQNLHKHGIKAFKLCTIPGYTYRVKLFAGNNDTTTISPTNVVMDLCSDLLNKGHTLYTNDWFTSVDLARKLLDNGTHLVGMIRKNRRNIPKSVVSKKLKKGKYIARESLDGITIMKWEDKEERVLLSTKHSDSFHTITNHGKVVSKPQIIVDYNKGKGAVKLSNQMASYSTPLRKSVKWYKKLAIDLLLNTSIVNALTLYKTVTSKYIRIMDFRKQILQHLCKKNEVVGDKKLKRLKHVLARKDGSSRIGRRTCQQCYKDKAAVIGAKMAKNKAKKVVTYCATCPNKPWLCLECFNKTHS